MTFFFHEWIITFACPPALSLRFSASEREKMKTMEINICARACACACACACLLWISPSSELGVGDIYINRPRYQTGREGHIR